jgi:hypothetical protein
VDTRTTEGAFPGARGFTEVGVAATGHRYVVGCVQWVVCCVEADFLWSACSPVEAEHTSALGSIPYARLAVHPVDGLVATLNEEAILEDDGPEEKVGL